MRGRVSFDDYTGNGDLGLTLGRTDENGSTDCCAYFIYQSKGKPVHFFEFIMNQQAVPWQGVGTR